MKKMILTFSLFCTATMIAWSLGALLYFTAVSTYWNNEERKEDADKNRTSVASNDRRGSKRSATATADWGNENLGTYLRQTVACRFGPKTVQRTATGNYSGNKLW